MSSSSEKNTDFADRSINYSFTPQKCWNSELDSIPAKKRTLRDYVGKDPDPHRESYKETDRYIGMPTDVWHECDNSEYPYSDYNEAVGVHNENKLRSEYVQDDYHLRAKKLQEENNMIEDRHNVAIERIRLRDEQRENMKPILTVFGAIYYLILIMIIARICMSMYDDGTLFSDGNIVSSFLFLFVSLFLLAAPLSASRISKDVYIFWKRWVSAGYKEFGLRPEKHPDAADNRPPQPLIDAQKKVLRDVGSRMHCWKYDAAAKKDAESVVLLGSASNRESCERENDMDETSEQVQDTQDGRNQYCWGSKKFCENRDCSGYWTNFSNNCGGDKIGARVKTATWKRETAARMGGKTCKFEYPAGVKREKEDLITLDSKFFPSGEVTDVILEDGYVLRYGC